MKKQGRRGKDRNFKSSKIFNPFARFFLALLGPGSLKFLSIRNLQSRCDDDSGIYLYHEEPTRALDLMKTHRFLLLAEFVSLYNDIRLCIKKSLIKVYFSSN